jgi:hypothetical protein
MTFSHKKPGVAFWATVVVVVALAYPLSLGPVLCLARHGYTPSWMDAPMTRFYHPISWVYFNGPGAVHDVLDWYAHLWEVD